MVAARLHDLLDGHRVVLLNRSATYAVGIAGHVPLAAICTLEDGTEFGELSEKLQTPILSGYPTGMPRILFPDESIERVLPVVGHRLSELLVSEQRRTWLWCPRPCVSAWEFANQHGLGNLCMEPELARKLQDKRYSLPLLASLGLEVAKGDWLLPGNVLFGALRDRFGLPFVAQVPVGVAGAGTTIVRGEADWGKACARSGGEALWCAPYIGDVSVNVNGVVTSAGVFVGWPSVQLTSMEFCCALPAAYCGNDYAAAEWLSEKEHQEIRDQMLRVGEWLAGGGYDGVFGMDLVRGDTGRFHPVDLNARWQGSTALLAQGESEAGMIPLAASALASSMGVLNPQEARRFMDCAPRISASFFALRAPREDVRCTRSLAAGVYSLSEGIRGQLSHLRDGFHLGDLRSNDEFLLGGGMPEAGQLMSPGAMLLRVTLRRPVCLPGLCDYQPCVKPLVKAIYGALALAPATPGIDSASTFVMH